MMARLFHEQIKWSDQIKLGAEQLCLCNKLHILHTYLTGVISCMQ